VGQAAYEPKDTCDSELHPVAGERMNGKGVSDSTTSPTISVRSLIHADSKLLPQHRELRRRAPSRWVPQPFYGGAVARVGLGMKKA